MSGANGKRQADGRVALVAHALEMMDRDHPEDLSIREVARRAGVSSGAPYHYFRDKTGLLAACAVVAWAQLCEALEATASDDTFVEQLKDCAVAYLDFALTRPGTYRLMTSRLLDDDEQFVEVVQLRGRAIRGVVELLQHEDATGLNPTLSKQRALAMWSFLHGYAALVIDGSVPADSVNIQEVAELAARMALLSE